MTSVHYAVFSASRYETYNPILKFSVEQLAEIRKASLSRILCDNLDVHTPVQRSAFDLPHDEYVEKKIPSPILYIS